jgi:hypothetical protein
MSYFYYSVFYDYSLSSLELADDFRCFEIAEEFFILLRNSFINVDFPESNLPLIKIGIDMFIKFFISYKYKIDDFVWISKFPTVRELLAKLS